MMLKFIRGAVVAGGVIAAAPFGAAAQEASPADTARFLAGMEVPENSPIDKFTDDRTWQAHARYFDNAWDKLDKQQISRVRKWSDTYLTAPRDTLFYFFSGPDFLYADAFFPKAKTYILAGLEPVGPVPQIDQRSLRTLSQIRASLDNTIRLSFFVTRDMNEKLRGNTVKGALPLLYVFLARSGVTIKEVTLIVLDDEGNEKPLDPAAKTRAPASGVKIVFAKGENPPQTLYYFSTDLSDAGVKRSNFLKFAEKFAPGDALVKSASYLLHGGAFTMVRNFLIAHTQNLVQDDTGVPLALLQPEQWELKPFGVYIGPIPLFSMSPQKAMRNLFHPKNKPPKLDFGIGYRWRGHDSNLVLAIRKQTKAN
jgi:hypothetical protein